MICEKGNQTVFKLFHDGGPYHIETSPLICSANQWTGFYMTVTFVMKELISKKMNVMQLHPRESHVKFLLNHRVNFLMKKKQVSVMIDGKQYTIGYFVQRFQKNYCKTCKMNVYKTFVSCCGRKRNVSYTRLILIVQRPIEMDGFFCENS